MTLRDSATVLTRFLRIIVGVNPKAVFWNLFLRFFSAVLPIAGLWIAKMIIDAVTNQLSWNSILLLVLTEGGIAGVLLFINKYLRYWNEIVNQEFSIKVTARILSHTNDFSVEELEKAEFYNLMARAIDETEDASEIIQHLLDDLEAFVSIVFYSISVFLFNPLIVFLFLLSIVPSVIGEYKFYIKFYELRKSWTEERREIDYLTWLSTTDINLKEVKVFDTSKYLIDKLSNKKKDYFKNVKRLRMQQVSITGLLSAISLLCYYCAYLFVIRDTISGILTIGTMVYLSATLKNLSSNVSQVFSSLTWLSHKSLYLNDFFVFLDTKPIHESCTIQSGNEPVCLTNCLEIRNLGYKYPNSNKWAFRNINLTISKGEKIALIGKNGSGKTTFLKVITGLYMPTEGNVIIDGHDIRTISKPERLFSIIFQDYIKYEFDVIENIAIGNINDKNNIQFIEKCAQIIGASDFINTLPNRYHQVLSNRFEDGSQISGGQWQKIAVARALFSNRPFLILDEPSASLDIMAEKKLFDLLLRDQSFFKGKTLILVSHRLAHIQYTDRILLMDNGKLIADGSHDELLQNSTLYRTLYETAFDIA